MDAARLTPAFADYKGKVLGKYFSETRHTMSDDCLSVGMDRPRSPPAEPLAARHGPARRAGASSERTRD